MTRKLIPICLLSFLAILLLTVVMGSTKASAGNDVPSLLYTQANQYDALAWMHGGERFGSGASILLNDATGKRALVPRFAASADASVSFNGQRVLFSGKENPQDPWQIWEVVLDGSNLRRVLTTADDCIRPFYLPENRIVYARKIGARFVIETVELAGGKPIPLTYGPSSAIPTDVLRDGRILFSSASPMGAGDGPDIYTVYSDGSGVESYRCDHGKGRQQGKETVSGDIVFAGERGLARFTSARAREVGVSAPPGEYAGDIVEAPSGDWLLSWRDTPTSTFRLMRWTPGAKTLRPLIAGHGTHILQPVLLSERTVPNQHPSGLHDWPNANLLCLNAYTSIFKFAAGSIQSVRLYTRDAGGVPRSLGTAPVEKDGSFFVQVPTEQPLQIELLDASGKILKRESGYFWMRRGEQRGCVGCHAGPETSPENAVPMTLLKSTTPADLTGVNVQNTSGGH